MRSTSDADDERRRDDGERHLEGHEDQLRDGARASVSLPMPAKKHSVETADVGVVEVVGVRSEGQRVGDDHPEHRHQARGDERLHQHREHVLLAHHAAVEEGEARDGHHQHERHGGEHPGGVAGVELRRRRPRGVLQRRVLRKARQCRSTRKVPAAVCTGVLRYVSVGSNFIVRTPLSLRRPGRCGRCAVATRARCRQLRRCGCAPCVRSAIRRSCRRRSGRSWRRAGWRRAPCRPERTERRSPF